MILVGASRSLQRNPSRNATSSITNFTLTALGPIRRLRSETARRWRLHRNVMYIVVPQREHGPYSPWSPTGWCCVGIFAVSMMITCTCPLSLSTDCHSKWYVELPLGAKWLIHGYGHQFKHEGFIAWIKLSSLRISLLIGNMEIVTWWCPGLHEQINGCNLYTGSALSAGFGCSCSITPPGTRCLTEIRVTLCVFILRVVEFFCLYLAD